MVIMRKFIVILITVIFLYGTSIGTAFADDSTAGRVSKTFPPLTTTGTADSTGTDSSPATNVSLTIQQAMDMALNSSRNVQAAQLAIQSNDEARKNMAQTNIAAQGIPSGPTSPALLSAFSSLRQSDINWQMSEKTLNVTEDAVVYGVLRDYIANLNAVDSVTSAQNFLSNAQTKINIARVQLQLGIISSSDASVAEATYKAAQAAVDTAGINESDAYHTFNKDLGLDTEARPILTERPQYSTFSVDDLTSTINSTVAVNPTVWLKYQAITLAQLGVDLYDYSSAAKSGTVLSQQINVQQANITASNTQEQAQQLMRTIYDNISKTEEQYNTQQDTLKTAQDTLRTTQVKYDVGMATKLDLSNAELAVNNATQALNTIIYQHELWKMAFEKPWAYSGAS
jgi:outer membrane protein